MLAVDLLFIRLVCAVIFAFKKVFFRHLVIISQFRVTFCDFRKDCSWRGMTPLSSCSASLIHINQPPPTHFLYPLSPGSRGQQGATLDESSVHCRATQRKMNINFIWSLILGKFQLQSVFSLPEQLSGVSGFISPLFSLANPRHSAARISETFLSSKVWSKLSLVHAVTCVIARGLPLVVSWKDRTVILPSINAIQWAKLFTSSGLWKC